MSDITGGRRRRPLWPILGTGSVLVLVLLAFLRVTGRAVGSDTGCAGGPVDDGVKSGAVSLRQALGQTPAELEAAGWVPCPVGAPSDETPPTPDAVIDFESVGNITMQIPGTLLAPEGRVGKALALQDGVAKIPYADLLNATGAGGTIALWFYTGDYNGRAPQGFTIFDSDQVPGNGNRLWLATGTTPYTLVFHAQHGLPESQSKATPYTRIDEWNPNEWHHLAGVWQTDTGGTVKLFIDGQLRAAVPVPKAGFLASNPSIYLWLLSSKRNPTATVGNGRNRMDRLVGFNRALTDAEVIAFYRSELDLTGPVLASGASKLTLLGPADGYGVLGLTHGDATRLTTLGTDRSLWRLQLSKPDSGSTLRQVTNIGAAAAHTCLIDPASGSIGLTWEGVSVGAPSAPDANGSLRVQALVTPNNDAFEMRLQVDNTSAWTLDAAAITLGGLRTGSTDGNSTFIGQDHGGTATPDALRHYVSVGNKWGQLEGLLNYPSLAQVMPWVALVDASPSASGVYLGAHDFALWSKAFLVRNTAASDEVPPDLIMPLLAQQWERGLDMDVLIHAENMGTPGNGFAMDWPVVLKAFTGDWYDAARIYREWLIGQPRLAGKRIRDRNDYAEWFTDVGQLVSTTTTNTLTTWNNALALLSANGNAFDPTGYVMWHMTSWQKGTVQTNDLPFPTYVDKYPGDVQYAATHKIPFAPYTLATVWDVAQDAGVLDTGTINYNEWNSRQGWHTTIRDRNAPPNTQPCGVADTNPTTTTNCEIGMCPASQSWRTLVTEALATTLADTDGLYLDVVGALTIPPCHSASPSHTDHLPGGGTHFMQGTRQIIADLRANPAFKPGQHVLYIEGCADAYIDQVEGCLTLGAKALGIPLTTAVLHDYTQLLGAELYLTSNLTAQSYYAATGRSFAWGIMPGFLLGSTPKLPGNTHWAKDAALVQYNMRLARARRVFKNYLVYGEMLRPPTVYLQTGSPETPALVTATPAGLSGVPRFAAPTDSSTWTIPHVMANLWRDDNGTGLVVVSLLESADTNVFVPLNGAELAALTGTGYASVSRIDPLTGAASPLSPGLSVAGVQGLSAHLAPLEVLLVEFSDVQQCIADAASCDDGIACTEDQCSAATGCFHTPNNTKCNDNVGCTADHCDGVSGCVSVAQDSQCSDGVPCTLDRCNPGKGCVALPQNALCDDNVTCTADTCHPVNGCVSVPQNALCDDKLACSVDTCTAAGCAHTPCAAPPKPKPKKWSVTLTPEARNGMAKASKKAKSTLQSWTKAVAKDGLEQAQKYAVYEDTPLPGSTTGERAIRLDPKTRAVYTEATTGNPIMVTVQKILLPPPAPKK